MKKKILFVVDVKGWAWWFKACAIGNCLKDEFDFDVWFPGKSIIPQKFDLYLTFCPPHLSCLKGIGKDRKVTGVTSHIFFKECFGAKSKEFYRDKVAALHANSMLLYESVKGRHSKSYYVPNGVDTSSFPYCNSNQNAKLVVGFVGSRHRLGYKGFVDYIEPAIQSVKGVDLKANFCIYSNKVSQAEMLSFYRDIDMYIVASVAEGTPNPMLEAASCGRPTISNKVGNALEFIKNGESGFLVERDVSEYVKAIQYFKDNQKEVERMGLIARRQAELWDWKIQAENYRNMFREICG